MTWFEKSGYLHSMLTPSVKNDMLAMARFYWALTDKPQKIEKW